MNSKHTFETLHAASSAYNCGLTDLAMSLVDDALIEGDPIAFRAWFLTETNPEYRMVQQEFLFAISDYCKTFFN